jgi:hypothetical protein
MFMVKIPLEIAPLNPPTSLDSPSTLFEPLLLITHAASVSCGKKLRKSNKGSSFEDSTGILQHLSSCWCNKFFKNISVDQCRIHNPGYYMITA